MPLIWQLITYGQNLKNNIHLLCFILKTNLHLFCHDVPGKETPMIRINWYRETRPSIVGIEPKFLSNHTLHLCRAVKLKKSINPVESAGFYALRTQVLKVIK